MMTLQESIDEIKKLIEEYFYKPPPQIEIPLTVKEAAAYLTLSVPTVYSLISKNELPVLKRSKRCYFLKEDLLNYLKDGRKKSIAEIEVETDAFLSTRKRKEVNHG